MRTNNLWQRWEKEVEKFEHVKEHHRLPEITMRTWRRSMLFMFMQDLMKNVLNENESVEKIMGRVIEAIQIGCGFKRIRIYLADEKNNKNLYLWKTSKGHGLKKGELKIRIDKEKDDAVETFSSGEPLAVDDISKLEHLKYKIKLDITGPYVAIPLIIEDEPFGLICADTASDTEPSETIEYKEHFKTFARTIMAAIENRKIFDQRNQQIELLKLIDKFSAIIQGETIKEKLFESLLELSVKLVEGNSGHFKLYNSKTKTLERVADCGEDVAPPEIKHKPISIGFSNWVFKNKKCLIIGNVSKHSIMKKHKAHWKKQGEEGYLKTLESRKSAIVVPLITYTGDAIGILDIHSKTPNKFSERDEENLKALVNSVIYAVEKTQQLDQQSEISKKQRELLSMRDKFLEMLKDAVKEAHIVNSVLEIIRDSCHKLVNIGNIKIVCLSIKDPYTNELTSPSVKCVKSNDRNCSLCLREELIIQKALNTGKNQLGKNDLALPILLEDEVIGVLYLEGEKKIVLNDNEVKILDIIISTAAILIKTAKNYEIKIKQGTTLYEAVQITAKMRDFREWFHRVMEKVMEIIGRKNRNFHLLMVKEVDAEEKLFVRETSDLFIEGKPSISLRKILLNKEIPKDKSLSGYVMEKKKIEIISDIEKNEKLENDDPNKLPHYSYDEILKEPQEEIPFKIGSEVAIPLKINKGKEEEKVIGTLVIDSIIPNDFQEFDLKFHETIANYLAIAINSQQLYEERAKYQEEQYRLDRNVALQAFMKSFIHDITAPVQEIRSQINIMNDDGEARWNENLNKLEYLSDKLLLSYGEFVKDFTKPFSEPAKIGVKELISNTLKTIEKTSGLGIYNIKGNFRNSDIDIECYPVFIEMAFRTIINNAIEFSRKLRPEERYLKIDVKPLNKDNSVNFSFESSTIERIPPDQLKQIFKPFVRIINKNGGHGLGLSLAAECINLHNGKIRAENVEEKSAVRFHITLPKTLKISKEYQND